jgi:chromosome segregation ATPase
MDSVNITVTEGQSNNFFSRLQQQINQSVEIQNKREIIVPENTQENTHENTHENTQENVKAVENAGENVSESSQKNSTSEFLSKINSTSKNLGHNKLQLKIDDLESRIEKYKIVEKEQEMKINLFKKTISTLQTQLQDKAAYISRIESAHIDPQYDKKIQDLTREIYDLKVKLDNAEGENVQLKLDVEFINNKLETARLEYDNSSDKNEEVQKRYIVLEQTYQKQANQLQIDLETISRLENKINLELNIRQNLELELQSLKLELANYRTNIKNITIMKDDEIKLLTDKLNESDKQIPQMNKQNDALIGGFRARQLNSDIKKNSNKGIKTSSNKGIKPT